MPLQMEATGCTETSVTYSQSTLRNMPEERRTHYTMAEAWNHRHKFISVKQVGILYENSEIRKACWYCVKGPGNLQHVDWETVDSIPGGGDYTYRRSKAVREILLGPQGRSTMTLTRRRKILLTRLQIFIITLMSICVTIIRKSVCVAYE
jgi:hypothetical protein